MYLLLFVIIANDFPIQINELLQELYMFLMKLKVGLKVVVMVDVIVTIQKKISS